MIKDNLLYLISSFIVLKKRFDQFMSGRHFPDGFFDDGFLIHL